MTDKHDERPVMLSLISEQAIPNVMAALLVEPRPRAMVCILSEDQKRKGQVDREFESVFNGIRDALARIDPSIKVINWASPDGSGQLVSPSNAGQVKQACQAVRQDSRFADASWIYNVTGGTKVMAQAALDDARAAGCQALYVDTESRQLIWYGVEPFEFDEGHLRSVGVAEYLAAYGVAVKRYNDSLADDLRQAARLLGQDLAGPALVEKIIGDTTPAKDETVTRRFGSGDLSQAEQALLHRVTQVLSQRDVELNTATGTTKLIVWTTDEELRAFFWGGRWLESYTFDTVCQLSQQSDEWQYNSLWRNVLIEWSGIQYSGLLDQDTSADDLVRPTNELDVAATRGARLLVCECKTGTNALDPKHLYKLHVVGHKLGTFADKVLITNQSDLLDRHNKAMRHRVARALTLNIVVVQVSQLPALDKILADPEKVLKGQKRQFELTA